MISSPGKSVLMYEHFGNGNLSPVIGPVIVEVNYQSYKFAVYLLEQRWPLGLLELQEQEF